MSNIHENDMELIEHNAILPIDESLVKLAKYARANNRGHVVVSVPVEPILAAAHRRGMLDV